MFNLGKAGFGACLPIHKMKTFLCLLSLAGFVALATTGCEVEERGGYYGHAEYGHGYYHHDGYWDRGHYYHDWR